MQTRLPARDRVVQFLVACWGASTFFPLGVTYSWMLLLLGALLWRRGLVERWRQVTGSGLVLPALVFLGWNLVVVATGPWLEDTGTRMFHLARVVVLLTMGLMLTPAEARAGLLAYLSAAVCAALVIAAHHVWGLPEWDIWGSLLRSRNNFSSGNMIMMATAAGLFVLLGLRRDPDWFEPPVAWGAALALTVTVAAHSVSRNAQVLLPALVLAGLFVYRRNWRAVAWGTVIVVAMASLAWQFSEATRSRFAKVTDEYHRLATEGDYTTGVGERWLMASEAWRGMVANPWLGTGLGSWLPHWREIGRQTGQALPPDKLQRHIEINNPHNEYMLAGMETGVPGLLVLVFFLGSLLRKGWRTEGTAGGVAVLLCVSLSLSAVINAPLRDAAMGMTLLWLLGASLALRKVSR